jgi:hypothetical protein
VNYLGKFFECFEFDFLQRSSLVQGEAQSPSKTRIPLRSCANDTPAILRGFRGCFRKRKQAARASPPKLYDWAHLKTSLDEVGSTFKSLRLQA